MRLVPQAILLGVLLAGLGTWAGAADSPLAAGPSMTVADYLRLQSAAADDDEAARFLGAYVAGLYSGLVVRRPDVQGHDCQPAQSVRDILQLIDIYVDPARRGDDEALARMPLARVLDNAITQVCRQADDK